LAAIHDAPFVFLKKALAAVHDAPSVFLKISQIKIAATDDAGNLAVGEEECAVQGHDVADNNGNEVAQQRSR
jgi:hypothetical protein